MNAWQRCEPAVSPAGDVGGDIQASDAWDARWQRPLPDGMTAMVTRAFYEAREDGKPPTPWLLECQTEYLICRDPADPGGTEVWSDADHTMVPRSGDAGDARKAALNAAGPTAAEWAKHAPGWAVA
jgi:hypothetical protein